MSPNDLAADLAAPNTCGEVVRRSQRPRRNPLQPDHPSGEVETTGYQAQHDTPRPRRNLARRSPAKSLHPSHVDFAARTTPPIRRECGEVGEVKSSRHTSTHQETTNMTTTFTSPIGRDTIDQITDTYRQMTELDYHPSAPSDGSGNITGDIDVPRDAHRYAKRWWAEEDRQVFDIGCPDYRNRPAFIFAIEAARIMCGMTDDRDHQLAIDLLRLATEELTNGTPRA